MRNFLDTTLLAGFFAFTITSSFAEHPALPNGGMGEGTSNQSFSDGAFQLCYTTSAIAGSGLLPGDRITGVSLRLNGGETDFFGSAFESLDIRIGTLALPVQTIYDDNFAGTPVTVKTGPYTVLAPEMQANGPPHSFGKPIPFDRSWVYPGGPLAIEFRASGSDGIEVDVAETVDATATVDSFSSSDTSGSLSVGPAWVIAFEIVRDSLPRTVNINIPGGASEEGNNRVGWGSESVYQMSYSADELGSLAAGDEIAGICLRLDLGEADTAAPYFERFDIRVGPAAATFNGGGFAFADNYASPPVDVRSGPLAFYLPLTNAAPNPFGDIIYFDAPYTYTGGDLIIEWRMSPSNSDVSFDAVNGQLARTPGNADATIIDGFISAKPIIQLKVDKDYSALISSLNNKIKKLKKRLRKAKARDQKPKAKKFQKKIKQIQRQIRTLSL